MGDIVPESLGDIIGIRRLRAYSAQTGYEAGWNFHPSLSLDAASYVRFRIAGRSTLVTGMGAKQPRP